MQSRCGVVYIKGERVLFQHSERLCFLLKWGGLKLSVCLCGRVVFDGLAVCSGCRALVTLNTSWLEHPLRPQHLLIITKGELFVHHLFYVSRKPDQKQN